MLHIGGIQVIGSITELKNDFCACLVVQVSPVGVTCFFRTSQLHDSCEMVLIPLQKHTTCVKLK